MDGAKVCWRTVYRPTGVAVGCIFSSSRTPPLLNSFLYGDSIYSTGTRWNFIRGVSLLLFLFCRAAALAYCSFSSIAGIRLV